MAVVGSVKAAAQTVFVVSLVPQEAVVSALALHSATHSLTKIIGPSIGGVLLTFIGPSPCLLIHAMMILCMLITFLQVPQRASAPSSEKGEWATEIIEGFAYLRDNHRVLVAILTAYSNGFFGISYSRFLPYFAEQVLEVGPSGYGLLVSAPGAGAVGISFLLSTHTKLRRMRRMLLGASLIYAAAIFLFVVSPYFILSLLLLAVVGATQMTYRVVARAIIQEECPDYLLGRAMSVFFLDRGFGSLGAVCVGSVAALVSVPFALAGSAVLAGLGAWVIPKIPFREKAAA
jgi:predicted MFS family arabinose efflux permease